MIQPLIPVIETEKPKTDLKNKYGFNNNDLVILSLGSIRKDKGSQCGAQEYGRSPHETLTSHGKGAGKTSIRHRQTDTQCRR